MKHAYDDLNRRVRSEDALLQVTSVAYDAVGNVLCSKAPKGSSHLGTSEAAGLTVEAIRQRVCEPSGPGNFVAQRKWDEESRLVRSTSPLGHVTRFLYDAQRNLVAMADANGHLATFEFDALNRRTAKHIQLAALPFPSRSGVPLASPPSAGFTSGALTWRTTFDFNGNPETVTDPKRQVASWLYGILDRPASATYSGHSQPREWPSLSSVAWEYDENGNATEIHETKLGQAGDVVETTLQAFDKLNRLKLNTRYDTKQTAYSYDAKGNRTSVTDWQNAVTAYTFDALDRVKTVTAAAPLGQVRYAYFPDGLLKSVDFPDANGLVELRCYDGADRLTRLATARQGSPQGDACGAVSSLVSSQQYTFDANGNRVSMVETLTPAGASSPNPPETTDYGFDDADWLVGQRNGQEVQLYQLDVEGNRVGEKRAPASAWATALTVAAFTAISPASLTHDIANTFSRADWLIRSVDAKDASREVAWVHDENGNVVSRQVGSQPARTFKWDARDALTAVLDGAVVLGRYDYNSERQRVKRFAGAESVEYVLDGKYVLNEHDAVSGADRRYHYGGSAALAIADAQGARFLNLDALGSPTQETNASSGAVSKVRQTDAWGRYRNGTAPGVGDAKYSFTGHQFDVESGLTYARARYYDAETGRFLSPDILDGDINNAPSLHRYAYASFNPLRYTDPDGLFSKELQEEIQRAGGDVSKLGGPLYPGPELEGPQPEGKVPRLPQASPVLALMLSEHEHPTEDEAEVARYQALLNAEAPATGDAADIRSFQRRQAGAREWEQAKNFTLSVSKGYLKHLAVPYLMGEAGVGIVRFGAPVVGRAVARDLAAGRGKAREMVAVEGRTTGGPVLKEAKPPPAPPPAPPSGGGGPPGGGSGSKPSLPEPDPIHVWEGEGGALGPQAVSPPKSGFIDPKTVRFSQDSIKGTMGGGSTIDELAEGLRSGAIKAEDIPAIRVFERDGMLFTLDNRRLEAFKRAGVDIPYRQATPKEVSSEAWKFTTKNEGVSIRVRGK